MGAAEAAGALAAGGGGGCWAKAREVQSTMDASGIRDLEIMREFIGLVFPLVGGFGRFSGVLGCDNWIVERLHGGWHGGGCFAIDVIE